MFNKKLKSEHLTELVKRVELINEHILISQALELQRRIWLQERFKELGIDIEKKYEINFKTGEIKLCRQEPTKENLAQK